MFHHRPGNAGELLLAPSACLNPGNPTRHPWKGWEPPPFKDHHRCISVVNTWIMLTIEHWALKAGLYILDVLGSVVGSALVIWYLKGLLALEFLRANQFLMFSIRGAELTFLGILFFIWMTASPQWQSQTRALCEWLGVWPKNLPLCHCNRSKSFISPSWFHDVTLSIAQIVYIL